MTKIVKVNPILPEIAKIREAARIIRSGGLVAFPTETVYGLGANALDKGAVLKIFAAKSRPPDNPLIVHICSKRQLHLISYAIPKNVEKAMDTLWPGPVTFLVRKRKIIPDETTAGSKNVAVRMPAHPVALRLIEESSVPIAAPSANLSTKPSPTRAEHVIKDLYGKVDLILDGGSTEFGLESTIIDTTSRPFRLLRPGALSVEELSKLLGPVRIPGYIKSARSQEVAIAPGIKYRHYAPEKPLYMAGSRKALGDALSEPGAVALCSREFADAHRNGRLIVLGSESNLYEVARNLFDSFRRLDESEAKFGVIQSFPEKGIGMAIMNRIRKAAKPQ